MVSRNLKVYKIQNSKTCMWNEEWSIDKLLSKPGAFDWIVLNKTGKDTFGQASDALIKEGCKKWARLHVRVSVAINFRLIKVL